MLLIILINKAICQNLKKFKINNILFFLLPKAENNFQKRHFD